MPINGQTYILKYFISTPTCFSASVQPQGVLTLCLLKIQIIKIIKITIQ